MMYSLLGRPKRLEGPIKASPIDEIKKHMTNYNFRGTFLQITGVESVAIKYGPESSMKQYPILASGTFRDCSSKLKNELKKLIL